MNFIDSVIHELGALSVATQLFFRVLGEIGDQIHRRRSPQMFGEIHIFSGPVLDPRIE
jgi:hypothetical protein